FESRQQTDGGPNGEEEEADPILAGHLHAFFLRYNFCFL
ncbi:unnamed protein product, partial [Heterotrigona itama]